MGPTDSHGLSRREGARLRTLGAATILIISSYAALLVYAGHGPIPYNALKLPLEEHIHVMTWFPQGWKFFTRDPREESYRVFAKIGEPSTWRDISAGPSSSPRYLLGFDRTPRARGIEVALILHGSEKLLLDCSDSPVRCLDRATPTRTVENITPAPTICGDIGIVLQKPVPWAWAQAGQQVEMPSRVIRLLVRC